MLTTEFSPRKQKQALPIAVVKYYHHDQFQATNMKSLNPELGEMGKISSYELALAHYRIIMINKIRNRPVKLEIW